jgi:hypothetical protein
MAEQKQIFRKVALDRLSSPEQIDRLMQVTTPQGWLALLALVALLMVAVIWGIFGRIQTTVEGQGVLITSGGSNPVLAAGTGTISELLIESGQEVAQGQKIATLLQGDKSSDITSALAGRVAAVHVKVGDAVKEDTTILTVDVGPLEAVVYVLLNEGQQLKPGMVVDVSPATVLRQEYGSIVGVVKSVGSYPASHEDMLDVLDREDLVEQLAPDGLPLEVRITLETSADTPTGYKWTSLKGPSSTILPGTPCSAVITVKEERPISKVLPIAGAIWIS